MVFLTLGDPTVYSTYWYVHRRVAARGYAAELVPGVPSFCAAAAAMGPRPVRDGNAARHSVTHGRAEEDFLRQQGAETGRSVLEVRELLGSAANSAARC